MVVRGHWHSQWVHVALRELGRMSIGLQLYPFDCLEFTILQHPISLLDWRNRIPFMDITFTNRRPLSMDRRCIHPVSGTVSHALDREMGLSNEAEGARGSQGEHI